MLLPNMARAFTGRPAGLWVFLAKPPKKRTLDVGPMGRGLRLRQQMLNLKTPHQWARDRTPEQWADHHMKVVVVLIALAVFVSYPMGVFILDAASAARHARSAAASAPAPAPDGSGVVVARNDTTGTITIQHSGVARLGLMPGATPFRAPADIIKKTDVGDQVIFTVAKDGDGYAVTELQIPAFKDRSDPG
jgi:Cu/Ag efflux protein CusF